MARARRVLPGFGVSLTGTMLYLLVLVVVPLAAVFAKAFTLTPHDFWQAVATDRAVAAYKFTLLSSLYSAAASVVLGFLVAWVLVRYEFFGKRLIDSLVDLPFALPTAVAGLVYSNLYSKHGAFGEWLTPMGIKAAYSGLGVVLVLTFLGIPFVVRTLQPVLESLDADVEEAASLLGASRWQTFLRVLFPPLLPAMITGFSLSLARGIGEYGSLVFISGNKPMQTEIAPVLIIAKLEGYAYAEATAIAAVLLVISFTLLIAINILERWSLRHAN